MTAPWQPPRCECGHTSGDHVSAGPRSFRLNDQTTGGPCLAAGCPCSRFAVAGVGSASTQQPQEGETDA